MSETRTHQIIRDMPPADLRRLADGSAADINRELELDDLSLAREIHDRLNFRGKPTGSPLQGLSFGKGF